jgi:hypothetical protein
MAGSKLQIRGDIQIQLAKVGYELRRLQREVETMTLDRPPSEEEQHLFENLQGALKALRTAEDHAELVGFYVDALDDEGAELEDDL